MSLVAEFDFAFAQTKGAVSHELDWTARAVRPAVLLYKGDLLEGYYQGWCLLERERLQNMHLNTLDKLMVFCQARGL